MEWAGITKEHKHESERNKLEQKRPTQGQIEDIKVVETRMQGGKEGRDEARGIHNN